MSGTKIDRRAARTRAAAKRNDGLIERAAKRADWAGAALESAAGDLDGAHGPEGNALTGLAEVVLDEAGRVSHLAEDIGSQRVDSDSRRPAIGKRSPHSELGSERALTSAAAANDG
jgi:hypothetical protein